MLTAIESIVLLIFFGTLLLTITALDTASSGFFSQQRIGKKGQLFTIYKLRTHHKYTHKVSVWGNFLRRTKLDEIPQIINILKGEMTLVGPRPDVPGYADELQGEDKIILTLKPGITGLASLKYRNEEALLAQQTHPQLYNDEVIWPDKVRINKWYAHNRTFVMDLQLIFYTFFPVSFDVDRFIDGKSNK